MTRKRLVAAALASLAVVSAACTSDDKPSAVKQPKTTGSVRIGVWMPPDPATNTYGAAAVRILTQPQLFRATPDGKWEPDLVASGSDKTARDAKSARFRLKPRARWSDGTRITSDDLRRTMDARFVTAIDDATTRGTIVVHFTQPLPGWRRLWSGIDAIAPPKPDVWGGRYTVASVTPNLETVLRVNPTFYGASPHIRTVRLVLVPDPEIAARLMDAGELDVIAPLAFSARTERLGRIKDAHVVRGANRGGWTAALITNPAHLPLEQRLSLFGLVDLRRFVNVLLAGEATPLAPGKPATNPSPPTTRAVPALSSPNEAPPAGFLVRAVQRSAHDHGITIDLRQGEFDQILGAYASSQFDAMIRLQPSSPDPCWVCEAASVDAALAAAADAKSPGAVAKLEAALRDQGLVLPIWRERPVVAVRDGLDGVTANGFSAAGPAWSIENWVWSR